jgi:ABC-type dipeptide/oligopeptide/nickel transport system permease subunit
MQTAPWMMIYPGCALLLTVVVFNLLGDALRDYMDIKM